MLWRLCALANRFSQARGPPYPSPSLTLYKVWNGNTNLAEIDDADFDNGTEDTGDAVEKLVRQ
jgi:hypothetical protein